MCVCFSSKKQTHLYIEKTKKNEKNKTCTGDAKARRAVVTAIYTKSGGHCHTHNISEIFGITKSGGHRLAQGSWP